MNKHDASYRLLFHNPHLVRGLFQGIVSGPWLEALDWDGLQALPTDYISDKLRQRQGDCVWRIPRRDGQALFLLLMLEHQSNNDHAMALRMLTYRGLLYETLLRREPGLLPTALPAVLPLVLYSGVPRWSAAIDVADLIEPAPPGLQAYQPTLRYLLVDEGRLVEQGGLPGDNLAALLFRLEHNRGLEDVQKLIQTVYNCTDGPQYRELRRAFVSWTRHVLLPRALPQVRVPPVDDLLEITDMLADQSRSWTHQWKMEGLQEGLQEGRQEGRREGLKEGLREGRQEGELAVLKRLLARKFGPLPEGIEQRLKAATPAQLETWSLNILDAETLEEVFLE
jgi:predicted transposase YdaD